MGRLVAYAQDLSDPWGSSLLGERRVKASGDAYPYLEEETDGSGRETSWRILARDGSVVRSRITEYDGKGRPLLLKEYFSETEGEVVHRFERSEDEDGLVHETERVEYSGELGSIFERELGSDGSVLAERELDADGEPVDGGGPSEDDSVDDDGVDDDDGPGPRDIEEKDERGRVVKRISSIERNGAVFVQTTSLAYEGACDKPSMMRVDRVAIIDPDAPPRPLSSGFRQARYDESGRLSELLLVAMSEGDFEPDRLYRFEHF